jgi:integrase
MLAETFRHRHRRARSSGNLQATEIIRGVTMASVRKRTWKTATSEIKTAWVVDYANNHGARQRKHFANKKAADAFRIGIEGQMQAGTYRAAADKVTVRAACESFLEHCEGRSQRDERMTRKMLTVYKGHVTNYILPGVGSRKLSQFTARSVGDFRDRIRTAGVTVPTTRKILATLHGVLEHAISQDWVATNAARGTKVIGPRGEGSKKIVPPSKDDVRAVIDTAGEALRLKFIFAASTGARAGEQWATRWRDVNFDKGELQISRRVDAYGDEGAPKSAAGVRTVPLSGQLVAMLKAWKLKSEFSKANDLIFPNRQGRHLGHDNLIKRQFLPLFDELPIVKPFNWHGLRHFAVSCWIEAGLAPKTVQTFAGHASLQVTMDRYGHLFPSADHGKAMDQIAKGLFA